MMAFEWLKLVHVSCALLSVTGFALRGYWMLSVNPLLQHRLARVLPHCIDTLVLASAVGMLVIWQLSPFAVGWLAAKVLALLVYIGLGMVALRFGRSRSVRLAAYLGALLAAAFIVAAAYSKSAWGLFALLLT